MLTYLYYFNSYSVPLPDGGSLVIEQTEAFVSIDVNSGRSTSKNRTSQEKASLKVNIAAAKQVTCMTSHR